jgi:hypothetical protein
MRAFYLEPAYHHAADRWDVEDGIDLEKFCTTANEEGDKRDRILAQLLMCRSLFSIWYYAVVGTLG